MVNYLFFGHIMFSFWFIVEKNIAKNIRVYILSPTMDPKMEGGAWRDDTSKGYDIWESWDPTSKWVEFCTGFFDSPTLCVWV